MRRTDDRSHPDGAPLLRLAGRLLASCAPEAYREAVLGDLIEEWETVIRPRSGAWRAGLWLAGQVLGSLPPLLGRRVAREVAMLTKWNGIVAALILSMGALQAWDSHVHRAGATVIVLAALGIALPAGVALLSRDERGYVAAVVGSIVLLLAAKIVSPIALPALGVIAPMAAMALFFLHKKRGDAGAPIAPAG